MLSFPSSVYFPWAIVYAGLGAFFFVASRRIPGRGHELFATGLLGFGLLSLVRGIAISASSQCLHGLDARMSVFLGAFGGAIHTHFIALFFRQHRQLRHVWFGYAVALGATLADWVSTWTRDGAIFGGPPEKPIGVFVAIAFLFHLSVSVMTLHREEVRGLRLAKWPFWCILALGPLLIFDMVMSAARGVDLFFGESVVWLYALCIALVQLAELRGAEGLLEQTTSSLAERTAELQISYAEIELMSTELSRKEQLAAVGELAAAIAHEVRNPLAIIMNASSGLRRKNLGEGDRETLLSIVDEESLRLNQLVAELLRFARPVHAARAPTSLLDICEKLRQEAPPSHEIVVQNVTSGEQTAVVDSALFRLALDNLVDNARHAMPSGGAIEILLRPGKLSDGSNAIGVVVRDSGAGMTDEELEKCRRPFFTTRPRGTGLGLPIVERIIEANGGELHVESIRGQGTSVTLLVPVEASLPSSRYPGSKSPSQRRRLRSSPALTTDSRVATMVHGSGTLSKLSSYAEQEAPPPPSSGRVGPDR